MNNFLRFIKGLWPLMLGFSAVIISFTFIKLPFSFMKYWLLVFLLGNVSAFMMSAIYTNRTINYYHDTLSKVQEDIKELYNLIIRKQDEEKE